MFSVALTKEDGLYRHPVPLTYTDWVKHQVLKILGPPALAMFLWTVAIIAVYHSPFRFKSLGIVGTVGDNALVVWAVIRIFRMGKSQE